MIIQITYDLNKPGQNYTALIDAIKRLGISWAHPCESCWLVNTSKSTTGVRDALRPHIDINDSLLINRFDTTDYTGWLSQKIWDWLKQQIAADPSLRY